MNDELMDDPYAPHPDRYVKSHEPKTLTVMSAMDWLHRMSKYTKLSDAFIEKSARVNGFLSKKMSITPRQAVLLSIYGATTAIGDSCSVSELSNHLGCSNFEMIALRSDIRELERRRLIIPCSSYRGNCNRVTKTVVDAMEHNSDIVPENREGLDFNSFFAQVMEVIRKCVDDKEYSDREITLMELNDLMDGNGQLNFVQAVRRGPLKNEDELLCFFYFAHQLVNWDREGVCLRRSDLDDVIDDSFRYNRLCHAILNGESGLVRNGLVEAVCDDGMSGTVYRLTEKAVREYLDEYKPQRRPMGTNGMLTPDKITPKALFYNADEQREVERLASILDEKNYKGVGDRLEKAGMRRGICVMLSGGPGTGKTETVLQLARRSGRPIIQVNVNDIMDKFVGESEKRATAIFDNYREVVKKSDIAPILFLNECDQLLGKRIQSVEHSVDQMSNALQNIFLQQMESLEGILICTTNLVKNLDSAFERRFLFKIEFHKPCREARISIWKSMLPTLTEDEAEALSDNFDFSGGQIENVSRKALIDMALTGMEKPSLEQYLDYCQHERFDMKKPERRRVGF